MQMNEYRHIEELLERFFEGETSNAEEQELYRFFVRQDLPESLKPYRPVFEYFETGIAREVSGMETGKAVRKVPFAKRWLSAAIAVAASLLLLFVLNIRKGETEDNFNPYAGSYIIRNGVRTEIPEEVAREIDKMVQKAEKRRYEKERLALRPIWQYRQTLEKINAKEKEVEQIESDIERLEER